MAHVVAAGAYFGGGIESVLEERPEPPRMTDQGAAEAPSLTAAQWWERLTGDRQALFERVLGADPGAHLHRTIEHPMFGLLNWRETLLFIRLHDLDHAGQLRTIAAALGAPPAGAA
jgi:hypothetical protein